MNQVYRWLVLTIVIIVLMSLSLLATIAQDNAGASVFATNTPMNTTNQPVAATPTPTAANAVQVAEPTLAATPIQVYEPEVCRYVEGQPTNDECRAIIEANPEPNVNDINLDSATLDLYSFWRVGPQAVTTFDAPNGNITGEIPAGFNFINVVNQTDGWLQSEDGGWVNIDASGA